MEFSSTNLHQVPQEEFSVFFMSVVQLLETIYLLYLDKYT